MRRTYGFTLIELLVVIAILSVLMAMLMPVFFAVREKARAASCTSQVSQLYKAARMYSDDYDRAIVPARTAVTSGGSLGITWCVILQPYIKNDQILVCPDDEAPLATAQSTCLPHSYGINYSLSYNTRWGPYPFVASMTSVDRVSDMILFFDMKGAVAEMGSSYYAHRLSRLDLRHSEMGNFAFLDGHVKALRKGDVDDARMWDPFTS